MLPVSGEGAAALCGGAGSCARFPMGGAGRIVSGPCGVGGCLFLAIGRLGAAPRVLLVVFPVFLGP